MARRPWLKWYPADWRSEAKLRMVSRGARSLWVDMIGLMHEADPYGHLIVGGVAPSTKQLAMILGDTERETVRLLKELETAGVFSRTDDGTIFSRRMIRDFEKAEKDRENGSGGGNPKIKGQDNGGVNPPDNRNPNGGDKAQIPEARHQRPSSESARERATLPQNQPPRREIWPFGGVVPEPWITTATGERQRLGLIPVDGPLVAAKYANLRAAQANQPRTQTEWQADFINFFLNESRTKANGTGQHGRSNVAGTLDSIAGEIAELEGLQRG